MTISAINPAEALKQAQHKSARHENPSLKLVEDMRATGEGGTLEVWESHAAEMQKIGYVRVWPVAFELLGKSPKGFTALKQTVVAGAVAECVEKFEAPHYFAGENLDRTMKRIGAIFLLARKVDRAGFVQASFGKVLVDHGIAVPDYLNVTLTPQKPRHHEETRVRRERHHTERQSEVEMFRHVPERVEVALRSDGTCYEVRKHKPAKELSPEEVARRQAEKAAAKRAKQEAKAAKAAAKNSKKKEKKEKGGSKGKKHG